MLCVYFFYWYVSILRGLEIIFYLIREKLLLNNLTGQIKRVIRHSLFYFEFEGIQAVHEESQQLARRGKTVYIKIMRMILMIVNTVLVYHVSRIQL